MAENHELRLKIDAAGAKRGSREFVAAIAAIKRAVSGLERDSSGTFTKLVKNMRDAAAASKNIKMGTLDRRALRDLDAYANTQRQALRAMASSRRGAADLAQEIRNSAAAYADARNPIDSFNKSLAQTNRLLTTQIQLAQQARSAVRGIRPAASPTERVRTHTRARAGTDTRAERAADRQASLQNRARRAVDDTRASVEQLTTALMKIGGLGEISRLGNAFQRLQRDLSGTTVSARQLDNAKTNMNTALKNAQAALATLTAKAREEARVTKEAAQAARAQARAARELAAALKAETTERERAAAATARQQNLQLSAAASMRRAELEAARLTERLRGIGDTRGVVAISQALIQLKARLSGGVASAHELRVALSEFANAANKSKVALIQVGGAQQRATREARALAREEITAANAARRMERDMRSVAAASNASAQAFRNAAGNMRGLENAFSASFQAGSLFRNLLGTLTLGTLTREIFLAGDALDQFRVTMEVARGSIMGAANEIDFLDNMSRRLGIGLREARTNYAKFAVASDLAGVSAEQTREIFESVSMAMAVLGRNQEDQNLAFLALEQMMSKGTVSAEELRRQLGERLPGAVNLMAQAIGVTTSELQDMLKAGEVISAEVLPKFAARVKEVFGPGLQAATKRAGLNMRQLQVEFEKFLETVSQSGFMQVLALEFNELTNLLRSSDMTKAAESIGAAIADMAEAVGAAASFITRNFETIGAVAQAIFGGIVARQAVLLVRWMTTMAQGVGAAIARFQGIVAPVTAAEAATFAYTNAVQANTVAVVANSEAHVARNAALMSSAGAYDVLLSRQIKGARGLKGVDAAARGARGGLLGFAGAMAGASSVLGALAGPVAIVVTALLLLPDVFDLISSDASEMADDIEAAVRRSGVAFDDFSEHAADLASNIALTRILDDMELLGKSVENFTDTSTLQLSNLQDAIDQLNGKKIDIGLGNDALTDTLVSMVRQLTFQISGGINPAELDKVSRSAGNVVKNMAELTQAAIDTGDGFLELQDHIAAALIRTPTAAPALRVLQALIEPLARAEAGLVANRDRLVELYGTVDERLAKSFADMGKEVVRTGRGLREFEESAKSAMREHPGARAMIQNIVDSTTKALDLGTSFHVAGEKMQGFYDDTVRRIEGLRNELGAAELAAAHFGATFERSFEKLAGSLGEDARVELEALRTEFERFDLTATVGIDHFTSALKEVGQWFPIAETQGWTAEVTRQFLALDSSQQTLTNLEDILKDVAAQYGNHVVVRQWTNAMREQTRVATDAGLSFEDFRDAVMSMDWSEATRAQLDNRDATLDAAEAMTDAERAALAASLKLDGAAASARNAGIAMEQGAAGVRIMAAALDSLRGAQVAVDEIGGDLLKGLREELEISKLDGLERELAQAFSSNGKVGKALEDIDGEIAKGRQALATAANAPLEARRMLTGELEMLLKKRAEIASEGRNLVTDIFNNEEARRAANKKGRKGGGGKSTIDELKSELERLQEEAFETDTALGKLARSSDTLTKAMAAGLVSSQDAVDIMHALTVQTADSIAEEEDLGKMYLSTTEIMRLNNAERQALHQSRVVEHALAEAGIDMLNAENAALIETIRSELALQAAREAAVEARDNIIDRVVSLKEENRALELVIQGQTDSIEVAKLMAAAEAAGISITDERTASLLRQAEAAEKLNDAMTRAAKDPVREWLDSVPTWEEAGEKIEVGVINSLSEAIAEFAKTGKISFASLAESILDAATKIIADKAVKELYTVFGLGGGPGQEAGFMGGLFDRLGLSSRGDAPGSSDFRRDEAEASKVLLKSGIVEGSTESSKLLQDSIMTGGDHVNQVWTQSFDTFATRLQNVLATTPVGSGAAAGGGSSGDAFAQIAMTAASAAFSGGDLFSSIASAPSANPSIAMAEAQRIVDQLGSGFVMGAEKAAPLLSAGIESGGSEVGGMLSSIFGGGGGAAGGAMGGAVGLLGSLLGGSGGSGFMSFLSPILGIASMLFKEGGTTDNPGPVNIGPMMPVAAFQHAPQFADGTANTSGIPAFLHDNEAVIPLSRNRKVPVEMRDSDDRRGGNTIHQTFNISTPDADSFRRSQKQIAADGAAAQRRALRQNN